MATTSRSSDTAIPPDFNSWNIIQLQKALNSWDIDFESNAKKADLVYHADEYAVRLGLGPRLAQTLEPGFSPDNWTIPELRRFFISQGADYRPRTMKRDMVDFFQENAFNNGTPRILSRSPVLPAPAGQMEHTPRFTTRSPSRDTTYTRSKSRELTQPAIRSTNDSDSDSDNHSDSSSDDDEEVIYYSDNDPPPSSLAKAKKSVVRDTQTPSFVYDKKAKIESKIDKNKKNQVKQREKDFQYMMQGALPGHKEAVGRTLPDEKRDKLVQLMAEALESLSRGSVDQAKLLMIEAMLAF